MRRHNGCQSLGVPNAGGGHQPSHQAIAPGGAAAATTNFAVVAVAVLALVLVLNPRSVRRLFGGNLPLRNGRAVSSARPKHHGLGPYSRRRRGLLAASTIGAAQEGEEEKGLADGQERLWKEQHEKYHLLKLSCRRHQAPVSSHSIP